MSKPTASKTSTSSNAKSVGTKHREPSKDRNGVRKVNPVADNANVSSVTSKSKPSVKVKTSLSDNSIGIKKSSKTDLTKVDSKRKLTENQKSNLVSIDKSSPKVNKTLVTTSKSLSSIHQNSLTKSKRSTAPETPPSNRVTKTQYFPSKNLYSNVVKQQMKEKSNTPKSNSIEIATTSSKESTKTGTLKSNKIKSVKSKTEVVTTKKFKSVQSKSETANNTASDIAERPRTATLKRGSIVNSNIAGPGIPISETPSLTSLDLSYEQEDEEAKQESEYNYEDDFDSYESDFEEYHSSDSLSSSNDSNLLTGEEATSSDDVSSLDEAPKQNTSNATDEERMLDSGNFDLPESKHKQLLDNIKESNEQENFKTELTENSRSNMASLSDEGFEEGKSSLQSGNLQFINFANAQKKWQQNKNLEKRRKRGEEILNMIRLDHYNFTLIDIPPVSYDVFMQSYGKTNTVQARTQTGDDDTSEEIQTDIIETISKWTQFPVTFSKINDTNPNYLETYKKEFLGVGGDSVTTDSSAKQNSTNCKQLGKFFSFAGQIILNLLEESAYDSSEKIHQNSREIPFSNGYIKFDTKLSAFLKNRPITFVSYCSTTHIKILTVHGKIETDDLDENDKLFSKTIVCLWSVLNTKEPQKILVVTGELSSCCFVLEPRNLILGGLCEGSIAIWDISEDNWLQTFNKVVNNENYVQQPNYTTEIDHGHSSKIVSIRSLNTADHHVHNNFESKSSNNQICSLDEGGTLIVWGVITKNNTSYDTSNGNMHSVPWNQISLVQNLKLSLRDFNQNLTELLCTDMNVNAMDPHHLFISTNYGYVIHCLATGTKANPKKYSLGTTSQANCLESCLFSPLYFLAGHDDGAIVLYSRLLEKPLMTMSNKEDTLQSGIELLQWSYHKPCVFYAKDRFNTIHVWDLAVSDLYPIYSVPFKENITCMKLSPPLVNNSDTAYMILASQSGSVCLHILNKEHGPSSSDQYQHHIKKFLNYVSRL